VSQPYPPHAGYGPPLQQYQPAPRNGFGITALVVGLIGICLGFIPLFGLGAIIAGIIAVTFGLLGFGRARRGVATNKSMSLIGTIAGVIAGALGIWGLVIVASTFSQLGDDIKGAAPSVAAPIAPAQSAGTVDQDSTTGSFGQNIKWPDGVNVTVSAPKPYRPSSSAAVTGAPARLVSVTVTLTNGSDKNIRASGTILNATANGERADQIYDSAKGVGGSPDSTILPGKSVKYTVALGLPSKDAVDLQVELQPSFGFGYQSAIFTGKV
jgi:hypothetical protein